LWKKLAQDWKPKKLAAMATRITLDQLPPAIDNMLKGRLRGRTVVNLR
jgi:D-arabinose 1-dehydrogenase-like Zn-dependent alcohol dehydrogenase